jgi:hypothetical protein
LVAPRVNLIPSRVELMASRNAFVLAVSTFRFSLIPFSPF